MARIARTVILLWAVAMIAGGAHAADALTPGDLGWLQGNLNLAADSPALLDLTAAQQSRLHALIANRGTNPDKKRQVIVQLLTEATDRGLEQMLEESTKPAVSGEVANRPR